MTSQTQARVEIPSFIIFICMYAVPPKCAAQNCRSDIEKAQPAHRNILWHFSALQRLPPSSYFSLSQLKLIYVVGERDRTFFLIECVHPSGPSVRPSRNNTFETKTAEAETRTAGPLPGGRLSQAAAQLSNCNLVESFLVSLEESRRLSEQATGRPAGTSFQRSARGRSGCCQHHLCPLDPSRSKMLHSGLLVQFTAQRAI